MEKQDMSNKLIGANLSREASVNKVDEGKISLAFASSKPVERWGFMETLDMKGIKLDRINDGGALLINHNKQDYVGVVEHAELGDDLVARATCRFGSSSRAKQIKKDVEDGILTKVSFGYRVLNYTEDKKGDVTITSFEVTEISLVTVPADYTVGVGRELSMEPKAEPKEEPKTEPILNQEREVMTQVKSEKQGNQETQDVLAEERTRTLGLQRLGEKYDVNDLAREFIENGESVEALALKISELKREAAPIHSPNQDIGLTPKEVKNFTFAKIIRAMANPRNMKMQEAAGFELEVCREAAALAGVNPKGIYIPSEILNRSMNVSNPSQGGHTVVDDNLGAKSMIEIINNNSVLMERANVLRDLKGDLTIMRELSGFEAFWVGENEEVTESDYEFETILLKPKSVGASTYVTRKMLLQSDLVIDQFVSRNLGVKIGLAIDLAGFHGTGTLNQPRGVFNTTGVNVVSLGANGGRITRDALVDMESLIAENNADGGNLNFVTNSKVRGALRKINIDAGSGRFLLSDNGRDLLGHNCLFTNQIAKDLTKGTGTNLSAILFGDLSKIIVGEWGGLDLVVDPMSHSKRGGIQFTAFKDVDIAVERPNAFSVITDAIV